MLNIGIDGVTGNVWRALLWAHNKDPDLNIKIVAVNGWTAQDVANIVQYSTIYGQYPTEIKVWGNDYVEMGGQKIRVTNERNSVKDIPWSDQGVETVVDCTAQRNNKDAGEHVWGSVTWVIISAPATDDTPTYVMWANHKTYDPNMKHPVISNASCTTNCLAPLLWTLRRQAIKILSWQIFTVHAPTASQPVLDKVGKASAFSASLTSTWAATTIGKIFPELEGKLDGNAIRVPNPHDASCLNQSLILDGHMTKEDINNLYKSDAENSEFARYIGLVPWFPTAATFKWNSKSALLVPEYTKVIHLENGTTQVQTKSWYDNELAYAMRLLDLAIYKYNRDKGLHD